ncbi:MAG: hypothetical protein HOW73_03900, partial [Polyangiaceae bacterium]|nr:hypothetical protein [Polyangiaceae bacterium]
MRHQSLLVAVVGLTVSLGCGDDSGPGASGGAGGMPPIAGAGGTDHAGGGMGGGGGAGGSGPALTCTPGDECTAGRTCLNTDESGIDGVLFRISWLDIEKPTVLKEGPLGALISSSVLPHLPACGLFGSGTFNWLLSLGFKGGTAVTLGALPSANGVDY